MAGNISPVPLYKYRGFVTMENNETTQEEGTVFTKIIPSPSDPNAITFIDGDDYAFTIGLDQTGA